MVDYLSQRDMSELNCLCFLLADMMFLTSLSSPAKTVAADTQMSYCKKRQIDMKTSLIFLCDRCLKVAFM